LGIFPDCFIADDGLTPFKIYSEYIISVLLIGCILLLIERNEQFHPKIYKFLLLSLVLTIFSELAFTFYISVYGVSNVIGHLFKIITFAIYYKIILQVGFQKPQENLYYDLQKRNQKLNQALNEVKKLQKLMPICSVCKNIRDDEGYWHRVEDYLLNEAKIEFTHGICPDCLEKQYSDLND
jgi:hypothetical protein